MAAAASTKVKSIPKTVNGTIIVKSVKVTNNERRTTSLTSKTVSHINKSSTNPNNVKIQLTLTKKKKSEQQMSGNKVTTSANPSKKITESSKITHGLPSKTAVKFVGKTLSNGSNEPPKTVNSTVCNDKSVKHGTTTGCNMLTQSKFKEVKPKLNRSVIAPQMESLTVQTNETEILNPLVVGDETILTPSKQVVTEIEKNREELKERQMLNVKQKFSEHLARQEEHLDNLSEFLEKAYITKRPRPMVNNNLEEDKRLITSMDQLMKRHIPITESVSDIKERIRRKEQELINLLDTLKNFGTSNNDV